MTRDLVQAIAEGVGYFLGGVFVLLIGGLLFLVLVTLITSVVWVPALIVIWAVSS